MSSGRVVSWRLNISRLRAYFKIEAFPEINKELKSKNTNHLTLKEFLLEDSSISDHVSL